MSAQQWQQPEPDAGFGMHLPDQSAAICRPCPARHDDSNTDCPADLDTSQGPQPLHLGRCGKPKQPHMNQCGICWQQMQQRNGGKGGNAIQFDGGKVIPLLPSLHAPSICSELCCACVTLCWQGDRCACGKPKQADKKQCGICWNKIKSQGGGMGGPFHNAPRW